MPSFNVARVGGIALLGVGFALAVFHGLQLAHVLDGRPDGFWLFFPFFVVVNGAAWFRSRATGLTGLAANNYVLIQFCVAMVVILGKSLDDLLSGGSSTLSVLGIGLSVLGGLACVYLRVGAPLRRRPL